MREPVTVPLSRPIDVIDQLFTTLTVREPKGADLIAAGDQADGYAWIARIAAACSNIPIEAFQKLRGRDATALTYEITRFLQRPPPPSPDDIDSAVIPLETPVTAGVHCITELRISEPTGGDLMAAADGDGGYAHLARLAARCCNVPADAFQELPGREAMQVTDMIMTFLGGSKEGGSSVSIARSPAGGEASPSS